MMEDLLQLDQRLTTKIRIAEKPGLLRGLAAFFAHSGDSWFCLLALAVLWYLGSSYWKQRAIALGLSIIVTAIVVMAIKFSVKRRRPDGEWGGIYRATDPHSFPSGHATRAVMLAVMSLALGPTWLGVLLLIWAPLVALARVAMGVHYLSDVVAGASLGVFMGVVMSLVVKLLALI